MHFLQHLQQETFLALDGKEAGLIGKDMKHREPHISPQHLHGIDKLREHFTCKCPINIYISGKDMTLNEHFLYHQAIKKSTHFHFVVGQVLSSN
jgi:hypothetical protein